MDNGNVAGKQVGQLRKKKGGAEIGGQFFIQQHFAVVAGGGGGKDIGIHRFVSLTAASCHDHVHRGAKRFIALDSGIVQRQAGAIGAEPLPRLHLPLIASLGDLEVPIHRGQGMHGVGCEPLAIDDRFGVF